jgi:hypothetical protein
MLSDSGQGLLRHRHCPFCIVHCIVPGAAG